MKHRRKPGTIEIGKIVNGPGTLYIDRDVLNTHLYVCGGTGYGKSKFLEGIGRQIIHDQRYTGSGMILLDPHGSLYDGLMEWLAWHRIERPIIPIDLRRDDWIIAYNLLRQRELETSVVVDNIVQAMAHAWGQGNTDQTPLFARWAGNVTHALYEKHNTLVESMYLTDRVEKQLRQLLTADIDDPVVKRDWDYANSISRTEFDLQVSSSINRLNRFLSSRIYRSMFGQSDVSLDLRKALEEGWIILVCMATAGGKISYENSRLFGTLLLSDLWTAAQERGKPNNPKDVKPFYLMIDEFQRYVTPTIGENLDEARGFGLHLIMANQYPRQLLNAGSHGQHLYDSIMENVHSKVVFRLQHEDNLKPLAQWLFMGTMDPDEVKHRLFSTKVMDYREEMRRAYSHVDSETSGGSHASGKGTGLSSMHLSGISYDGKGNKIGTSINDNYANSWNSYFADTDNWAATSADGYTDSPVLIPVMGKELSHIQFRNLEEQLFRAMAALFDLTERQAVVRMKGMKVPVSVFSKFIKPSYASKERIDKYRLNYLKKWDFAIPGPEAINNLKLRQEYFEKNLLNEIMSSLSEEPVSIKRRAYKQITE